MALSLILRRQRVPGGERVHVVSPVRDFPVLDLGDRAEPIVVLHFTPVARIVPWTSYSMTTTRPSFVLWTINLSAD
jgi:hypothetical protein